MLFAAVDRSEIKDSTNSRLAQLSVAVPQKSAASLDLIGSHTIDPMLVKKRRRSRNRSWPLPRTGKKLCAPLFYSSYQLTLRSDSSGNYIEETDDNLKMNCDLCSRRETRLKIAARQIEWSTSKFLNDPSVGTKFWLEAAYRYLDEILSSHPEHRRRRKVAIPDDRNG